MNHQYIEDNHLVDRYVMNALSAPEERAFEEHFIGCQQCGDAIELTQALVTGIRGQASSVAVNNAPQTHWRSLAIAASALLAVVSSLTMWTRGELTTAQQQIAQLVQARQSPLVVPLVATRGPAAYTPNVLELGAKPRWFVLELEGPFAVGTAYTIRVTGPQVADALQFDATPIQPDMLIFGVLSEQLEPTDYAVDVLDTASQQTVLSVAMRVVARD